MLVGSSEEDCRYREAHGRQKEHDVICNQRM
jgi:hypothetical protein